MKAVSIYEAIGTILGHDMTRIVPGEFKGVAFKKGHIIREEDIPVLLSMGKEHVYVMEIGPDDLHENEAAGRVAQAVCGQGLTCSSPAEAKVNMKAKYRGILKIDQELLYAINKTEGIAVATLHGNIPVECDELVTSVKIIPLTIGRRHITAIEQLCQGRSVVSVQPLPHLKAGLVVTGSEVYFGRIEDKFVPVINKKLAAFDCELAEVIFVPDDATQIKDAILKLHLNNDIIFVSGGMSVDPDDVTPEGVRRTGANIEVYGTPVLPGAMFLMAYLEGKPLLGIPACGMFSKITILDIVLPKVLIGEKVTRDYIARLGHGGLCRNCGDKCTFPACAFGK